ncbi:MAG: LysM peptidoglycan-binding domain-containing protein [Bacteroidales bacterium]
MPALTLIIGLILPSALSAQVPVEVSGEKMIYGGKVFYMHDVQKGQTLYSISRAYKVTIDAISRENVIPASGIQAGQVLRIPSAGDISEVPSLPRQATRPAQRSTAAATPPPVAATPSAASSPAVDSATGIRLARERIMYNGKPYYMHEVLKGQTLYSIARAYKVTILDIDRENAISAGGLQAGQILRIPAISALVVQDEVVPPTGTAMEKPAAATQPGNTVTPTGTPKPADNQAAKVQDATTAEVRSQTEPKTQPTEVPSNPAPDMQPEASTNPAQTDKPATTTQATQAARQTEAITQTAAPVREPAAKQTQPEKKKIHKVQKGESLADIAKKYDITLQELKQANKGVIFAMPDMRLVIPVKEDQAPDNQ